MSKPTSDVAFTPAVKAAQHRFGSRAGYAKLASKGDWHDRVTPDLAAFLSQRDSFYLATASVNGQPYLQHRGGPPGFLKPIDEHTLAFADFSGNRQYISYGNLSENDRAFIFVMDYANHQRIKIWGRAQMVDDDPDLLAKLADPGYRGRPERALVFHLEAWDSNCPQHIPTLYGEDQVALALAKQQDIINGLQAELAALRPPPPT